MKPIVQVSLDVETVVEALELAEKAVRAGVDWLEVGTPLILGEGVHAVRALKERFPGTPLAVDLKIKDGDCLDMEMMAKARPDAVVVMGVAHPDTIRSVVDAPRDHGLKVSGYVARRGRQASVAGPSEPDLHLSLPGGGLENLHSVDSKMHGIEVILNGLVDDFA
jgi:3-hexulose-6-phosphate synthase